MIGHATALLSGVGCQWEYRVRRDSGYSMVPSHTSWRCQDRAKRTQVTSRTLDLNESSVNKLIVLCQTSHVIDTAQLNPLGPTMDDLSIDDEKKPFDALGGQNDEDSQPDPDEHIMLESGQGRVWLVKVRPATHYGSSDHPLYLHRFPSS
jgi:hypothetical protein